MCISHYCVDLDEEEIPSSWGYNREMGLAESSLTKQGDGGYSRPVREMPHTLNQKSKDKSLLIKYSLAMNIKYKAGENSTITMGCLQACLLTKPRKSLHCYRYKHLEMKVTYRQGHKPPSKV